VVVSRGKDPLSPVVVLQNQINPRQVGQTNLSSLFRRAWRATATTRIQSERKMGVRGKAGRSPETLSTGFRSNVRAGLRDAKMGGGMF